MCLGPVVHRQPGLPDALNIENYHQFNKVWPSETVGLHREGPCSKLTCTTPPRAWGPPSEAFYAARKRGYLDAEPHRHKFDAARLKREREAVSHMKHKNIPAYSVHLTLDGEERRFTYVESRYFYCVAYEALATPTEDFRRLQTMLREGYDLRLCGYDAFDVAQEPELDLYWHYCNPLRPFGHELVLYALLTVEAPEDYPWHRYRRTHAARYANIASAHTPST
jgi:hypothetical protein